MLQDPEERRAYDLALASRRADVVISDEIDLREMDESDPVEENAHEPERMREWKRMPEPRPGPGPGLGSKKDASTGVGIGIGANNEAACGPGTTTTGGTAGGPTTCWRRYTYPCRCGDCHEVRAARRAAFRHFVLVSVSTPISN